MSLDHPSNEASEPAAPPLRISSQHWLDDHLDPVFSFLRHELGNPVNSLKVTLEVLIRNYDYFDDAKRIDFLRRAQDQITRQQHLLEAMKRYTRGSTGEIRPIPFQSVWKKFQNDLRLRCIEKQINAELPQAPANVWIWADNDALALVLNAVVDNAVEAVSRCRQPHIQIGIRRGDSCLNVAVRDNGGGIPPDSLSKVFMPLFTTKEGAMGLGLPVARRVIQKMDGWLEIETDSKRYTEVAVKLRFTGRGGRPMKRGPTGS